MKYIEALNLLNTCVQHQILHEKDEHILVYLSGTEQQKEGWHFVDKDLLAKELMKDKEGQHILTNALKKKNANVRK